MHSLPDKLRNVGTVLWFCAIFGVAGEGMAEEPQRPAWYMSAGIGVNWTSDMKQKGRNRDATCYPEYDCSGLSGGAPEGYRWKYDLDSDSGTAFEISIGRRMFDLMRLELSIAQRKNDIESEFSSISYLDGSAPTPSGEEFSAVAAVDDLTTRTLSLNVYYDFPLAESRITPYLGAGLGLSFIKVSGLYYNAEYPENLRCNGKSCNVRQDASLHDTAFSKHLYAGADYSLNDRFLLGLKLSYTMVDDVSDTGSYSVQPIPGVTSRTEISDMDHWSLTLGLKYLFGN